MMPTLDDIFGQLEAEHRQRRDDLRAIETEAQRRARMLTITSGQRDERGLTDLEAVLLERLRRAGLALVQGEMVNRRTGARWSHNRVIEQARKGA